VKVKDAKRGLAGGNGNLLKMMRFGRNPGLPIPEIREQDTYLKGHKLYPRFMSYMDGDFSDVALVLAKMLEDAYQKKRRSSEMMVRGGKRFIVAVDSGGF